MKKFVLLTVALLGIQIIAYSQINVFLKTDKDFNSVAIQLTNKFDDEIILSTRSPMVAENSNTGIKVNFRDINNESILTHTYPLKVVGEKFYTAFPIFPQESILIKPDLSMIAKRYKNELKSIEVFLGFLVLNPTTHKKYKVWESFKLDYNNTELQDSITLQPYE